MSLPLEVFDRGNGRISVRSGGEELLRSVLRCPTGNPEDAAYTISGEIMVAFLRALGFEVKHWTAVKSPDEEPSL